MKQKYKALILLLLTITCASTAKAQMPKIVHDKEKEKQISVIEQPEKWEFGAKWYYLLMHKDYSGAKLNSNLKVKFRENRSNVKRVMTRRAASLASQELKYEDTKKERKEIEELWKEDMENQADRMIDLSYSSYKDDYNDLQDQINQCLTYCMTKSKGKMTKAVNRMVRKNAIICSNISYLRKTGLDCQLESSKREKGYDEALKEMKKIAKQTLNLALIASTIY